MALTSSICSRTNVALQCASVRGWVQHMPSSLFKGKETPGHPRQSSESTGMMGTRKQDSSVGNAMLGSNSKEELNPCLLTSLVPDRQ